MEIILGVLALELKLIPENVFIAIVFAALSSSIAAGPLLAWSIRRRKPVDIGQAPAERLLCTRPNRTDPLGSHSAALRQSHPKHELQRHGGPVFRSKDARRAYGDCR